MYITLYEEFSRGILKMLVLCIFSPSKLFTRILELIQLYKQNPLKNVFIFIIYQKKTILSGVSPYLRPLNISVWLILVPFNPKKAVSFDPISQPGGAPKNYVIWHIRKPCQDE